MQGQTGHLKFSEDQPWHMKSAQVMQLYYNTLDRSGGYYSHYCLKPKPREPLLQPIVKLNRLLLCATKHNDRWYIDQSALVWKAPPLPAPVIGESVKVF